METKTERNEFKMTLNELIWGLEDPAFLRAKKVVKEIEQEAEGLFRNSK